MNNEQQRVLLEEEKKDIEKDLNALGIQNTEGDWLVQPDPGDGTTADAVDNADITEDFEEKVARLNILEEQHAQIKKALQAIKDGNYGICEVGGEKISEERLAANPSATTCINHAE